MSITTEFFVPLYTNTSSLEDYQEVRSKISDRLYRHTFGAGACLVKVGIYLVGAAILISKTALKTLIAPVVSPIVYLLGEKQHTNSFTFNGVANDFLVTVRALDDAVGAGIQTICGAHKKSRSILEACGNIGKLIIGSGHAKEDVAKVFHLTFGVRASWSKQVFETEEPYHEKEVTEVCSTAGLTTCHIEKIKEKLKAP